MLPDHTDAEDKSKRISKFKPDSVQSLDARILQYKYAVTKLKYLLLAIDNLLEKANSTAGSQNVILVQYITALAFNLFAISDNAFAVKLSGLERFKTLKGPKAVISQVVTHVPYDMKDQQVIPLEELPSRSASLACLKSLKMMCLLCKEGYQKRLTNASRELNNADFVSDLDFLFENEFFNVERDFDLTLIAKLFPDASLEYEIDSSLLSSEHYSEAALIDMDLKSLLAIITEIQSMLDFQKPTIAKYRNLKSLSVSEGEKQFRDASYSAYSLHRVFFWSLRINEIYFILRRFGRHIYASNYDHLHDQNFLLFLRNPTYFKKLLSEMDEIFLATKKNGVLIATITRFIRMNSHHATSLKNVLSFVGYINQSVTLIESELKVLKEVSKLWIAGEMSFRQSHNIPTEGLAKVNDVLETQIVAEIKANRSKTVLNVPEKTKPSAVPKVSSTQMEQSKLQRSSKIIDKAPINDNEAAKEIPKSNLDSQAKKDSSADSPGSITLHKNSSSNSLQLNSGLDNTEKAKALTTINGGRKRSDSQPLSFNAAATALKVSTVTRTSSPNSKQGSPLTSPSGSIRRTSSVSKKSSSTSMSSPLGKRTTVSSQLPEIETKPAAPKLTANQKFQQHLLDASKSGILVGKEKKTLHDVVFDPSNPSSLNLRKQATAQQQGTVQSKASSSTKDESSIKEISESAPEIAQTQRPTRSQVTKRNTQRNSAIFLVDSNDFPSIASQECGSPDVSEASSKSSRSQDTTTKKVRFTGVPEYTPAEDEPSSQSCRILQKFATFKSPLIKSLRNEEGKALKHDAETQSQLTTQSLPGFINSTTMGPSRLTRFKNRF